MEKNKLIIALWGACLLGSGAYAQEQIPARGYSLIVESAQNRLLESDRAGSLKIPVFGQGFQATCDASWLTLTTEKNQLRLDYTANEEAGQRSATITLRNAANQTASLTVVQPGGQTLENVESEWLRIFPTGSRSNQCQPGADVDKTQDENYGTVYHSNWSQSISETDPAILTYDFATPQHIDLVNYVPVSGGGNGKFGLVDVYYKQSGASEYTLLGNYDFKMAGTPTPVYFGADGMDNITSVQFRVKTGYSFTPGIEYYATCAEMEFKRKLQPDESFLKRISGITATSSGVPAQSGEDVSRTLDYDPSTLFHTDYNRQVSEENPVVLTYTLPAGKQLANVVYLPRQDGGKNGNFGKVTVRYKAQDSDEFTDLLTKDFGQATTRTEIDFSGVQTPVSEVQFVVTSGFGGFVSCAEMMFYESRTISNDYTIFKDKLYTQLADGTTQADIDALTDPFVKKLAQDLFDKNYSTAYRVAEYPCLLSPQSLSEEWNTPGKLYDQLQGVTGINISKGCNVVVVSGADPGVSLALKVVAWFAGELEQNSSGEWVGAGPAEKVYSLTNGVNIINYDGDYDGLAYISYYAEANPENYSPVSVHFVYGQVNGYLSPDKTNEEMQQMCANARNKCMDLVGQRVHSVWTAQGLHDYCKASDGTSLGYRQYMNLLDLLIDWEHQLLGFKKYGRVPANKTMAYVNYTYYMFQGSYGVSFKYDQERRILNCKTLMYDDSDAIWGLSHEWGHQHQMQPYFCWAGLGESSNNMNSCYNVLHMGYTGEQASRIQNNWSNAYNHFFKDVNTSYVSASGDPTYARMRAYENLNSFSWCPAIQQEIQNQYNTYYKNGGWAIPSIASDPEHALSTNEVYVEENTAPFYMLHNYFSDVSTDRSKAEFQLDLYEALRQNDGPNGSSIEPGKTEVDKYELLASAQNGNKNGKYAEFVKKYPNSCWVTKGYIHEGATWTENSVPFIFNYIRKASKICGYNLFDYFDKFGFLRTVVMTIDDYGNKNYAMMEDMKAEFKADMEALQLKPITAEMIETMAHASVPTYDTPVIPN